MTRNQHAPMQGILGSFLVAGAFLTTAAHADTALPFSGAFVEGAVGYSRNDAKASDTNIELWNSERGTLTFRTHNSPGGKQSEPMGRLGLGYGYMLPYGINLAIVGSYNTSQKITSTTLLKNIFDVRLQPGYYIVPVHTLIYASVGYARASVSNSLGRADLRNTTFADGGGGNTDRSVADARNILPSNFPSSKEENVRARSNGLVLGGGLKFSPAGKFYVGIDYSYIRYQKKTFTGSARTEFTGPTGIGTYDAIWTQTVEPRSNNLLLTLGYYFF